MSISYTSYIADSISVLQAVMKDHSYIFENQNLNCQCLGSLPDFEKAISIVALGILIILICLLSVTPGNSKPNVYLLSWVQE